MPAFWYFGAGVNGEYRLADCYLTHQLGEFRVYILTVFSFLFYLPVGIIFIMAILIVKFLKNQNRKIESSVYYNPSSDLDKAIITRRTTPDTSRRNTNRKAFLQLSLIVLSFAVGYLPMTAYYWWSDKRYTGYQYRKYGLEDCGDGPIEVMYYDNYVYQSDYLFAVITYICMRISECMNPFLYCVGSKKLRVEIKSVLSSLREKFFCF